MSKTGGIPSLFFQLRPDCQEVAITARVARYGITEGWWLLLKADTPNHPQRIVLANKRSSSVA